MLKRSTKLDFGGIHCFPGGNLDKQDFNFSQNYKNCLYINQWQKAGFYTAVRELFEEVGIIIEKKDKAE